jgi:acylglycerol lipase
MATNKHQTAAGADAAAAGPGPSETYDRFTIAPEDVVVHKWFCDARTPARAIFVLQHGFGEYAERYLTSHYALIPKLQAEGFEVWALDFYGHGRSPGDRGMVDVTMAMQHHLEVRKRAAECGLPIFLFGHSLGGLVTAGSVASSPDGIAGVVLSSAALPAPMSRLGQGTLRLVASIVPTAQVPLSWPPLEELCHDQEQVRILMEDPMKHKKKISFSVAATAVHVSDLVWKAVGSWTAPTLAIHGTADSRAEYRQCQDLIEQIASQDKELFAVDGGYHELFNALEPKETFRHVVDWLCRHISS